MLLLHGVGLDPRLFDPVLTMLTEPAAAPLREPYADPVGGPMSVPAQAAVLADALAGAEDVTVVGVSGGATLALALALLDPPGVRAIVAHEPLIGPLAPELHEAVSASAATLASTAGPDGVTAFLERLVGPEAWARLPEWALDFARSHAEVVRAEVPEFAAFAPDPDALATITVPVTVTTGGESPPRRRAAAAALAELAPVRARIVDGAGHLVHVDQPAAYAHLIEEVRR